MNGSPSKPPSTQMVVKRDTCLLDCLTRLRTCLPPERSPTLAAVTKTRKTNPKVSTVINRLRTSDFLARIVTDGFMHHRSSFHTLTIDDCLWWTAMARLQGSASTAWDYRGFSAMFRQCASYENRCTLSATRESRRVTLAIALPQLKHRR